MSEWQDVEMLGYISIELHDDLQETVDRGARQRKTACTLLTFRVVMAKWIAKMLKVPVRMGDKIWRLNKCLNQANLGYYY